GTAAVATAAMTARDRLDAPDQLVHVGLADPFPFGRALAVERSASERARRVDGATAALVEERAAPLGHSEGEAGLGLRDDGARAASGRDRSTHQRLLDRRDVG